MFENLLMGIQQVFTVENLVFCLICTVFGIAIGAMPGLGPTIGMTLLIPLTYGMNPTTALLGLAACYCALQYGGSITAILIKTPGTGAAAATTFDGYQMTLKGKAGEALDEAVVASFWGGMLSVVALILIAPPLAKFALKFSAQEYFSVALFGLTIISALCGKNVWKGLIVGAFGMLLGCVGIDPFNALPRYTFGMYQLESGLQTLAVMTGMFSISRMFKLGATFNEDANKEAAKVTNKHNFFKDLFRYPMTYLRSAIIGIGIGIMPAAGANIATFISYGQGKRFSKEGKAGLFGTGSREGVACCEASNNGVTGGALVPTLTLGIPGSPPMAIFLSALMVHGLSPGYDLFTTRAKTIYPFMVGLFVANIFMLLVGYFTARYFAAVTKVPNSMLAAAVVIACSAGIFAATNTMFNVYLLLLFGVIGYFMEKYEFSVVPLVLGMLLGPLTEKGLLQGIALSRGALPFALSLFTRPISLVFMIATILSLISGIRTMRKDAKDVISEGDNSDE